MDPHELINLVQQRLRVRVHWTFVTNDFVEFRYATKTYSVAANGDGVRVLEVAADDLEVTSYSQWIEGVVNGCKRDDAGRLLPC